MEKSVYQSFNTEILNEVWKNIVHSFSTTGKQIKDKIKCI